MSGAQYQVCISCGRWTFNPATSSCESTRCTSLLRADLFGSRLPYLDAEPPPPPRRQTFVGRALRTFRDETRAGARRADRWRASTVERVQSRLEGVLWGTGRERAHRASLALAACFWLVTVVATGVSAGLHGVTLVELLVLTGIVSVLVSVMLVVGSVLAAAFWGLLVVPAIAFAAFGLWMPAYLCLRAAALAGRLSLLAPLGAMVAATRARQLWDGIFFTCPSRACGYRGLPLYVCAACGEAVSGLWPNLYGILRQPCPSCGAELPTLDRLGRDRLERRCGGCEMPLVGRHAGLARERLVAIAGGTGSGKTNFLLMTVAEATTGAGAIAGEIEDDRQAEDFRREWRNLAFGVPAPKTSEVASAFLLYARVGGRACQLYLYDAPGEEFASIGAMAAHQYFPLLEGVVLLVDPLSFDAVREREGATDYAPVPLLDVVTSTLVTASAGKVPGADGKIPLRVAVVISKADLASVRERVGDVEVRAPRGAACRSAIAAWGGDAAIRAVEHRFREVEYFACSPLGRPAHAASREPFVGRGVLEPLLWALGAPEASR